MAASVLGLGPGRSHALEAALAALFAEIPEGRPSSGLSESWTKAFGASKTEGVKSRKDLKDRVDAYQGTGKKPLAVDVATLHDPVRKFLNNWTPDWTPSTWQQSEKKFVGVLARGVKERQKILRDWVEEISGWLEPGTDIDKDKIASELRELLTAAKKMTLCGAEEIEHLRSSITEFLDLDIKKTLEKAETALSSSSYGAVLMALAGDYEKAIRVTRQLIKRGETTLDSIERGAADTLESGGVKAMREVIGQVEGELEQVNELLNQYSRID